MSAAVAMQSNAQPPKKRTRKVYPVTPMRERADRYIKIYDLADSHGWYEAFREAQKGAECMLWMNWQDNKVPRDLNTIAWEMFKIDYQCQRMQVLDAEPDEQGERHAHDATPRELVKIRDVLVRGYLAGFCEGFGRFLLHDGGRLPRIVSNYYAGWR